MGYTSGKYRSLRRLGRLREACLHFRSFVNFFEILTLLTVLWTWTKACKLWGVTVQASDSSASTHVVVSRMPALRGYCSAQRAHYDVLYGGAKQCRRSSLRCWPPITERPCIPSCASIHG